MDEFSDVLNQNDYVGSRRDQDSNSNVLGLWLS